MTMPVRTAAYRRVFDSVSAFTRDETGSIGIFMVFMFVLMFMFGGIAVDVMRFETRRVALQQTMDRAALAAASLTQTGDGRAIAQEWFDKADIAGGLDMVDYTEPTILAVNDAGLRRVTINSEIRSYNYFIGKFYNDGTRDITYLEGPALSEAAQGVSDIEVMLVLDITGSMGDPVAAGDSKTKIEALREAAAEFVNIVKGNDSKNGISIGVVPYAAQVNVPAELRAQFNETNVSTWDGVANAGVPNINCLEFPTSSYSSTGFSLSTSVRVAAVADANSGTTNTTNYVPVGDGAPNPASRACTTNQETGSTAWVDAEVNKVMLPTKDTQPVLDKVSRLTANGNTYIAVGMRWGTALIDEAARPIYTSIGDASVQGRPDDNDSTRTRKIIILMTDGEHVTNNYIYDAYKTGLSPIYRGADGNFAIRFTSSGTAATNGSRPGSNTSGNSCSGWQLSNYSNRQYFVPHLKRDYVRQKSGNNPEGQGTGTNVQGACDPQAWLASPSWSGSGTVRQLDWSEVWRYLRVSWVARQLYNRSGVSNATNYNTIMNMFRGTYLSNVTTMNSLLQTNCAAARTAGIEIYGIAFAAPANGQTQINGCSSSPKENYYFNATDSAKLSAAFRMIAIDISELRLTQ
jgi:Flp pilus assembly protein TadG